MKIIQKALVKKDGKFLVVLRSPESKYFANHWDFPGGKLEKGEKLFDGIEREVMEETNLKVKALKKLGTFSLKIDPPYKKTSHRFVVFKTAIISGKVRISKEHTRFRWMTKKQIMRSMIDPT